MTTTFLQLQVYSNLKKLKKRESCKYTINSPTSVRATAYKPYKLKVLRCRSDFVIGHSAVKKAGFFSL